MFFLSVLLETKSAARMLQERSGKVASKEETKKMAMRQQ
jgi:hypothetical protein